MTLLMKFFVAVVWLQLPSDGQSISYPSKDFEGSINRRSHSSFNETSSNKLKISSGEVSEGSLREVLSEAYEESDLSKEVTSNLAKLILKKAFSHPLWKTVIMIAASPNTMANPAFRSKWNITDEDQRMIKDKKNMFSPATRTKLEEFFASNEWKGILVLSSTKGELVDPDFREMWGLGELSTLVKDSAEGGKFFDGPQWKEFVIVTDTELDETASGWEKATVLASHLESILDKINGLK